LKKGKKVLSHHFVFSAEDDAKPIAKQTQRFKVKVQKPESVPLRNLKNVIDVFLCDHKVNIITKLMLSIIQLMLSIIQLMLFIIQLIVSIIHLMLSPS
jgi:hypothetical protein